MVDMIKNNWERRSWFGIRQQKKASAKMGKNRSICYEN